MPFNMNRATIFKDFLIVPLKSTIFEKFTFIIYIEILFFATHCFLRWQFIEHHIKPVFEYLRAFTVGEQAAKDPCLLRWQGGGEKMAGLLSP
jgi:hypothetical protein